MVALKSGLEIEVLSAADAARRRHWSEADKLRIVEASFRGSRQASAAAREHGISRSLLTTWRRQFREGTLGTVDRQPNFAPVLIAPESPTKIEATILISRAVTVTATISATSSRALGSSGRRRYPSRGLPRFTFARRNTPGPRREVSARTLYRAGAGDGLSARSPCARS